MQPSSSAPPTEVPAMMSFNIINVPKKRGRKPKNRIQDESITSSAWILSSEMMTATATAAVESDPVHFPVEQLQQEIVVDRQPNKRRGKSKIIPQLSSLSSIFVVPPAMIEDKAQSSDSEIDQSIDHRRIAEQISVPVQPEQLPTQTVSQKNQIKGKGSVGTAKTTKVSKRRKTNNVEQYWMATKTASSSGTTANAAPSSQNTLPSQTTTDGSTRVSSSSPVSEPVLPNDYLHDTASFFEVASHRFGSQERSVLESAIQEVSLAPPNMITKYIFENYKKQWFKPKEDEGKACDKMSIWQSILQRRLGELVKGAFYAMLLRQHILNMQLQVPSRDELYDIAGSFLSDSSSSLAFPVGGVEINSGSWRKQGMEDSEELLRGFLRGLRAATSLGITIQGNRNTLLYACGILEGPKHHGYNYGTSPSLAVQRRLKLMEILSGASHSDNVQLDEH